MAVYEEDWAPAVWFNSLTIGTTTEFNGVLTETNPATKRYTNAQATMYSLVSHPCGANRTSVNTKQQMDSAVSWSAASVPTRLFIFLNRGINKLLFMINMPCRRRHGNCSGRIDCNTYLNVTGCLLKYRGTQYGRMMNTMVFEMGECSW